MRAVEEQLVMRAARGDQTALEDLCKTSWRQVYAFVCHKVQNREEAEDVTQEAYARTLQVLPRYAPGSFLGHGYGRCSAHSVRPRCALFQLGNPCRRGEEPVLPHASTCSGWFARMPPESGPQWVMIPGEWGNVASAPAPAVPIRTGSVSIEMAAMQEGRQHGFDPSQGDTFKLVRQEEKGAGSGTGEATVETTHGDKVYLIHLIQPLGPGKASVWTVNAIGEKVASSLGPVHTGSVAIDMQSVRDLQEQVNAGHRSGYLDSLYVAVEEGPKLGLASAAGAAFEVVSRREQGPGSGTGEAIVEIQHGEKLYVMQLIQPNGPGKRSVWAVNSIRLHGGQQ